MTATAAALIQPRSGAPIAVPTSTTPPTISVTEKVSMLSIHLSCCRTCPTNGQVKFTVAQILPQLAKSVAFPDVFDAVCPHAAHDVFLEEIVAAQQHVAGNVYLKPLGINAAFLVSCCAGQLLVGH